jgi:hypothetical protein
MKKILFTSLLLFILIALVFSIEKLDAHAQESNLVGGLYFYSQNGEGVFYSFVDWVGLLGNKKQAELEKYGLGNISIYVDTMDRVANLGNLASDRKTFILGSKPLEVGDIIGNYRDALNPDRIIVAPKSDEKFEVIEIK